MNITHWLLYGPGLIKWSETSASRRVGGGSEGGASAAEAGRHPMHNNREVLNNTRCNCNTLTHCVCYL